MGYFWSWTLKRNIGQTHSVLKKYRDRSYFIVKRRWEGHATETTWDFSFLILFCAISESKFTLGESKLQHRNRGPEPIFLRERERIRLLRQSIADHTDPVTRMTHRYFNCYSSSREREKWSRGKKNQECEGARKEGGLCVFTCGRRTGRVPV